MSNSLERVLDTLEFIAARGEVRLGDVVKELDTSRATAFRVLAGLQSRGYVEHVRESHVYRLGPALKALAARSDSSIVSALAAPAMEELRAATSETVNLAVVRRRRIVYETILEGAHALRMSATVGEELPPHATALGKAILAFLPIDQRHLFVGPEPFPALTPNTITTTDALDEELAQVRAQGYAVDEEESVTGAGCLAAPILGANGLPVGGISVSGLVTRLPEAVRPEIGARVRAWCHRVSQQLGYDPGAHRDGEPVAAGKAPRPAGIDTGR